MDRHQRMTPPSDVCFSRDDLLDECWLLGKEVVCFLDRFLAVGEDPDDLLSPDKDIISFALEQLV